MKEEIMPIPSREDMPASTPAGLLVASKLEYEMLLKKKRLEDRIKKGEGLDWNELFHISK